MVWLRALTAESLAIFNTPQHLHRSVTGLGAAASAAAEHCPGGGFGVKGIGLAPLAAGGLVRLVTLITSIPAARRYRASAAP